FLRKAPPRPRKNFYCMGENGIVYLCARSFNRSRGCFGLVVPKRLFVFVGNLFEKSSPTPPQKLLLHG
ncbi:MAG: hypothetical protein IKA05_09215, partial [Clostridia bacterium]|nr:hypothetical protein [Clostridia bacterium]